jgi:hypothetical protein
MKIYTAQGMSEFVVVYTIDGKIHVHVHSDNTHIRSVFVEVGQMTLGLVYLVVR